MELNNPGREYPVQPTASVHTVIFREDQVLLVRRANEPSKGLWSVPGGKIELGEELHAAAKREIFEETGVECHLNGVLDVVDNIVPDAAGRIRYHYVVIYLLGRYVTGHVRAASDASDIRWVCVHEIAALEMNPVVKILLEKAFRYNSR